MKKKKMDLLPIILLLGIFIGIAIGVIAPSFATKLKPLGDIFLNLLFTIVVPLVFVSISSAVGSMLDMKRLGNILFKTVFTFIITGLIAGVIVLVVVKLYPPALGFTWKTQNYEFKEAKTVAELLVSSLTVSDFPEILSRRNMLPLIVFSVMFGVAVSLSGGKESPVGKFLNSLNDVVMKMVNMLMLIAPLGLGAYFANLVADFGSGIVGSYIRVMLIYVPLVVFYVLIFFPLYSYYAGGIEGVKKMKENILEPIITSIATQSSIATLPINKKACKNIGVPEDISNIVLPLGATMHMDGSVISGIIKISFLYGVFGLPFSGTATYATAILVAVLSAFVLSGAPGGGLVGEWLIVSLFGFPLEAFPMIATIGFLVDAPATMVNAAGDTIASMIVSRLVEGKNWLNKK